MKETTLNLYALDYRDMRTYMVAMLFILGNMVLPQLCHLIPQGGITWLPIYFFTLIGAYKYGWKVGLLTGVLSPILNSLFFGMPFPEVLPGILFYQSSPDFLYHSREIILRPKNNKNIETTKEGMKS